VSSGQTQWFSHGSKHSGRHGWRALASIPVVDGTAVAMSGVVSILGILPFWRKPTKLLHMFLPWRIPNKVLTNITKSL
jgi:hypothetical protein